MIHELSKGEGLSFLQLLFLAIHVDDMVFDAEEGAFTEYIDKIGFDMSLDDFADTVLEDVLRQINTYETRKQKIIFAEMLRVLYSDDIYDDAEKAFARKVGADLGFTEEEILLMEEAVGDYVAAYGKLMEIVDQGDGVSGPF